MVHLGIGSDLMALQQLSGALSFGIGQDLMFFHQNIAASLTAPRGQIMLDVEGDSIPAGYGTTATGDVRANSYAGLVMKDWPGRIGYGTPGGENANGNNYSINNALSGTTFDNMVAAAATIDARYSDARGNNAIVKILCSTMGHNGPGTSVEVDPVAFLSAYSSFVAARRSTGWKTLVCTILPSTAITDSKRVIANAGFRTMLAANEIDGLCDFDTESIMGDLSNNGNATYWQDGVHPTDAGHALLKPIFANALFGISVAHAAPTQYPPWDSSWKHASITLGSSDYTATGGTSFQSVRSTTWYDTGKVYAEIKATVSLDCMVGLLDARQANTLYLGGGARGLGCWLTNGMFPDSFTAVNAPTVTGGSTGGTVIRFAIDFDAGKVWITRDANAFPGSGDPVAGTNPSYTFDPNARLHLGFSGNNAAAVGTLPANAGQFSYAIPSGFTAW